MRFSLVPFTLLALSTVSITVAFTNLAVPSSIDANTSSQLTIKNDLSDGASSFDSAFTNFRTYLSITVPGFRATAACWLVNSTAIKSTNVTFMIPPSVGPDGTYGIATTEFNTNPLGSGQSSVEYSNLFALSNATGSWSPAELAGITIGDPDQVPCTAYDCARNCTQTFLPGNTTDTERETYECTAACPGVSYLSYAALLEEDCQEESGDNDTEASSVCAAASSASVAATQSVAASQTIASTQTAASTTSSSSSAKPAHTGAANQVFVVRVTLISTVFAAIVAVNG